MVPDSRPINSNFSETATQQIGSDEGLLFTGGSYLPLSKSFKTSATPDGVSSMWNRLSFLALTPCKLDAPYLQKRF